MNRERFSQLALALAVVGIATIGCDKGIAKAVETTPRAATSDTVPTPPFLKETGTVLAQELEMTPTVSPTPRPTEIQTPTATVTSTVTPRPTETQIFPTVTPTVSVEPTEETAERGRLPINPQAFSLSCELASAEIAVLWYNSVRASEAISMPRGFENFEDYFIASVRLADNPVEGYCGKVNGWLSVSCDGSDGAGYGVYPQPMVRGFQELGIPAEAIVLKDSGAAAGELKKILVDSYNNNQVLLLWGRGKNSPAVEFRKNPRTGEEYPMGLGEHCVAGQVTKIDGGDILIEISDPLPYGSGSRKVWKFETLLWQMRNMGWLMVLRIG